MHKGISGKGSAYLGAALIAIGILFNKWFIEATLISDHRIEARGFIAVIYAFQLLSVVVGAWLVLKQPTIRLPGKTEVGLLLVSIFLTFLLLEIGARVWLKYLTTPAQYDRYVLFTSLEA